ncbi:MAG: hypothetical protein AAFP04_09660 [Myxococcota bacterium]
MLLSFSSTRAHGPRSPLGRTFLLVSALAVPQAVVGCGSDDEDTPETPSGEPANPGIGDTPGGDSDDNALMACDEGAGLDAGLEVASAVVNCNGLDVITVPIDVVLAARPRTSVVVGGPTEVDVQVQLTLSEATVEELDALVDTSEIGEASADLDAGEGSESINVSAATPCEVDFSADADDNGMVGPIVVTTPIVTQAWTEVDGTLTVRAPDMVFDITRPVPLRLTTKGTMPACVWDGDVPSLEFAAP